MRPEHIRREAVKIAEEVSQLRYSPGMGGVVPLATAVQRLAVLVSQLAPDAPQSAPERLEEGVEYDLVLRVRATVVDVSDGHGLSYQLKLDGRDFLAGREVSVDHDEVAAASRR